jgi:hypothetical protein
VRRFQFALVCEMSFGEEMDLARYSGYTVFAGE